MPHHDKSHKNHKQANHHRANVGSIGARCKCKNEGGDWIRIPGLAGKDDCSPLAQGFQKCQWKGKPVRM